MTQSATEAVPAASDRSAARRRLALLVISITQLVFLLDATIVNVALPSIQRSLGFSGSGLEWVVTAYSITFGGLLLLGGRAGDVLGLRVALIGGLSLFTVASLLGGLAPTTWWLLACRALQGIGAAAASPAALSLIAATFAEGAERTRAIGAYTAIASIGSPVGLVAGGVIVTYLSWRWVLLVNVPVGVALVALAPRAFPRTGRRDRRFDVAGALTGTLSLTLLIYALINAPTDTNGVSHWGDPDVVASLLLALVLGVTFLVVESRVAEPMVPLRFFRHRERSGTYVALTLISTAMFGVYFFMTLYLQQVWGYSPLKVALIYVPLSIVLMAGAKITTGRVLERVGARRFVVGGLVLAAIGLAWLARINGSGGMLSGLLYPTLVTYLGFGLTTVPLTSSALSGVAPDESGLASGIFGMVRQIGGATGLAVLGTVAWATATTAGAGRGGAQHGLAVGAARGFFVAALVTALAVLVALVTVRDRSG